MRPYALVFEHDPADSPGAIATELEARGIDLRVVRGYAGDAIPASPGGASAVVVLGGSMAAEDVRAYPFLGAERELVRGALDATLPVLGVCLGAQILALALGGKVLRGVATEIGWMPVETEPAAARDPLFSALPPRFVPFHWHSDAIVLPPRATLLARSALTPVQAYRVGAPAHAIYGLQFHLESGAEMIEAMIAAGADELEAHGISGRAIALQSPAHVGEQERLARDLFGRWAEAVLRAARDRSSRM